MSTQFFRRVRGAMRSAYAAVPALFHYIALGIILYGLELSNLTIGYRWKSSIVLGLPCLLYFKTWRKPLSRPLRLRRIPYIEECRIYLEHYFRSSKEPYIPPKIQATQRTEYLGPSIIDLLPQEIIDRIIDHLTPDVPLMSCPSRSENVCKARQGHAMPHLSLPDTTFLSCALVCRAFRHRSQYHMWRSVHVRSAPVLHGVTLPRNRPGLGSDISVRTLAGKTRFFQDHTRFGNAVKHVQICLSTDPDLRILEQTDAKALLHTLTDSGASIDSMCLQMRNSPEHDAVDVFDLIIGPHISPASVSSLHLRDVGRFPLSVLGQFSSLRSLSLTRVEETSDRAINHNDEVTLTIAPRSYNPPRIEALAVGSDSMGSALRMVGVIPGADGGFLKTHTTYLDTSCLTHLDLTYTDLHPLFESSLGEVTALLNIVGSTVTHLKYTFDQFCMGGPDLNYANLRQTPVLRVLDVVFTCKWPDTASTFMSVSVGSVSAFLSNLAPGTLDTLNITFAQLLCRDARYPPKSILSMEWRRLDGEIRRIYGTGPSGRRLTVNFHVNYMGAQPDVNPIQGGRGGLRLTTVYAKWRAMTRAACHELFEVELPKQFPLARACPGIKLNFSYSTGTVDQFIDVLTDLSSRVIPA